MEAQLRTVVTVILIILLIICALWVNFQQNLLRAVIIFMSYSSLMCVLWVLMESPDLAITEAAVGAGISTTLFLLTLRRIHYEDRRQQGEDKKFDDSEANKK